MVCKLAVLKNICFNLDQKENTDLENGLNGFAGLILFYFHFYRYSKNEIYYNKAIQILENIFKRINGNYLNSNFSNGLSGIGWLIEHLTENNFIEIDPDSLFGDTIDEHIHQSMLEDLHRENFAFDQGASGKCFYFIKRYKNTKSPALKLKYKNHITEFIFFIERKRIYANYSGSNATGRDTSHFEKSARIRGDIWMVNTLLQICYLEDFDILVHPLLDNFSGSLTEKKILNSFQKIEVGFSLWKSGTVLNKRFYIEKSIQIFQSKIMPSKEPQVMNFFKSGIIFKEISETEKYDTYKKLQEQWMNRALKEIAAVSIEKLDAGLWNGLSGIGLSLLTFENDIKTNWQECYLY